MSLLTSFAGNAVTTAAAVIGTSSVAIDGGTAIAMVVGDRSQDRDFETIATVRPLSQIRFDRAA